MRISNKQIKKIIQEEIKNVLNEVQCPTGATAKGNKCYDAQNKEVAPLPPPSGYGEPAQQAAKTPRRAGGQPQVQATKGAPVVGVEEPEEDIGAVQGTGHVDLRRPKKKKIKYSAKVEEMQRAMADNPEIGRKLHILMKGRGKKAFDGQLGRNTQKAVNYLRRYYRKKGVKVPRGVGNVLNFLNKKVALVAEPAAEKPAPTGLQIKQAIIKAVKGVEWSDELRQAAGKSKNLNLGFANFLIKQCKERPGSCKTPEEVKKYVRQTLWKKGIKQFKRYSKFKSYDPDTAPEKKLKSL